MATEWDLSMMNRAGKKISVITCAYDEEACIDELARRLFAVFDQLPQYDFDIIAIENGSSDRTLEKMKAIRESDSRFRIVELARNFGLDGGFTAGLDSADSDAVVLMAADLQDPPELILDFVRKWEEGYSNVYGVIVARPTGGRLRSLNSALFYWLIEKMSENPLPPHARDFRLLDREVYEEIRMIRDPHPFHRGLAAWTGFPAVGVEFEQPPRFGGKTKASTRGVSEFAVRSIFTQSMTPLRVMPLLGVILVAVALVALVVLTVNALVNGVPFPGFGTILAVMIMMFGWLFLFLSVIGIYVGLIFEQVRTRPNYIIRRQWGIAGNRSVADVERAEMETRRSAPSSPARASEALKAMPPGNPVSLEILRADQRDAIGET
jgi:polyisoprenyl-phosphate glycosyltransferase